MVMPIGISERPFFGNGRGDKSLPYYSLLSFQEFQESPSERKLEAFLYMQADEGLGRFYSLYLARFLLHKLVKLFSRRKPH